MSFRSFTGIQNLFRLACKAAPYLPKVLKQCKYCMSFVLAKVFCTAFKDETLNYLDKNIQIQKMQSLFTCLFAFICKLFWINKEFSFHYGNKIKMPFYFTILRLYCILKFRLFFSLRFFSFNLIIVLFFTVYMSQFFFVSTMEIIQISNCDFFAHSCKLIFTIQTFLLRIARKSQNCEIKIHRDNAELF